MQYSSDLIATCKAKQKVIQSLYQMDSQFGDSLSKTIHQIRHPIRF
jgi:hypothetical protein